MGGKESQSGGKGQRSMSKRKSLENKRGTITAAARKARKALESPAFEFGAPPRPQGLDRNTRNAWRKIEADLLARRLLAKADTDLLLRWATAKAAGQKRPPKDVAAVYAARQPFPENNPAPPASDNAPATPAPEAAAVAKAYAVDITTGAIMAGLFVRQAAQRFLNDLETGPSRGITFDTSAAQHVIDYISALDLGALMPWQVFVLANLFGFKNADGRRRFRTAALEVSKKNGKSSLLAALGLYLADPEGDRENRAEVYCAATTKAQSAEICFREAVRLREKSAAVSGRSKKFKTAIEFGDSVFAPLAANSDKLNGRNIHAGILDELADHPTADLFNVFTSSKVNRKQPLTISITTAGNNREGNIAWHQRLHAAQVLEDVITDDAFFSYIATLDEGDSWNDEAVWIKANPSLGITVQIESLRELAARAHSIPSAKNSFLRYHLDIWPATTVTGWLSADDLEKQGNAYLTEEDRLLSALERIKKAEARLQGRKCLMGLDLALKNDLSALCILFPPLDTDGVFETLFRVYVPEENIEERSRTHRVPYREWADAGFLIPTPGPVTDFAYIRRDILALREKYQVLELGADAALGADILQELQNEGMKLAQIKQGFWMSEVIGRLERLFIQKKICYHGYPVARWCFSNVSLGTNALRRQRFDKEKSREKIDCAVALGCAYTSFLEVPPPNPYESRGLLYLDNMPPAERPVIEEI
jgi:phage terminase large subunit-like protein